MAGLEIFEVKPKKRKISNILSSSSITAAAKNFDVLTEILLRLPPKSLIRFQLVCKQWQSLIFDKYFTLRHACTGPKLQPYILLHDKTTSQLFYFNLTMKKLVPFSFPNILGKVRILDSCNGLLLVECISTNSDKEYYVCNPTTMKSRNLLFESSRVGKGTILGFHLKFNPSITEHYKVYCLRRSSSPGEKFCLAWYKSADHRWWYQLPLSNQAKAVYWYKFVHFIKSDHSRLFCFNWHGEYRIFGVPDAPAFPLKRRIHIFESGGRMYCAVIYQHRNNYNNLCVYQMFSRYWFRSWSVKLGRIPSTLDQHNRPNIRIIGMVNYCESDELFYLLFHVPGKIMVHRLYKGATSEVLIDFSGEDYYRDGILQFNCHDAHQFIESLARV